MLRPSIETTLPTTGQFSVAVDIWHHIACAMSAVATSMVGSGWLHLNRAFPERSYHSHLKHIHPACTVRILRRRSTHGAGHILPVDEALSLGDPKFKRGAAQDARPV